MASGDAVVRIANMRVFRDDSEVVGSSPNEKARQTVDLRGGTITVPTSGASLAEAISIVLDRSISSGTNPPETLFDSTKLYNLTIEEV